MTDKIGVVVPSNRPEELAKFKEAWKDKLEEAGAKLYVVEDAQPTWDVIKGDLGRNAWIIPVRSDCIRSYGYLTALRDGMEYIVTLDDDVRPMTENAILQHVEQLKRMVEPDNWVRVLTDKFAPITRGLPMARRIVVNHGLWTGVPDVPATVQLEGYTFTQPHPSLDDMIIPRGKFYPMSGMNLGWLAPITNYMYFTLQGSDIRNPEKRWGLDRSGDILAGVMSKIMIDQMPNAAIHSGWPWVQHNRASDPNKNLELERAGLMAPHVFASFLQGSTSYLQMAERLFHIEYPNKVYCKNLANAMRVWNEIVKKG